MVVPFRRCRDDGCGWLSLRRRPHQGRDQHWRRAGGEREVEDAIFTHPAIAECAVIAIADERWIEAIAAVVVLREGAEVTEDALLAHSRQTLAPFKVPKRVFFAEALPKNTAGKLLKRELRRAYTGQTSAVLGMAASA